MKVIRQGENLAIVVPKEFAGIKEGDKLELIEAKPGIYTLVNTEVLVKIEAKPGGYAPVGDALAKAPAKPVAKGPAISPEELRLLRKLDEIKYEERIPARVQKLLSEGERKILDGMVKEGFVSIYRGKKYAQTGVYDIPGDVYGLLRKKEPVNPGPPEQVSEKTSLSWDEHLGKYGYVIVENEAEAKLVSERLEPEIKAGEIMGTRGFDKKYYIAQRKFYEVWNSRIRALLRARREATEGEVCGALRMSEVACRVALELMREEGEVIEKKKGAYALA